MDCPNENQSHGLFQKKINHMVFKIGDVSHLVLGREKIGKLYEVENGKQIAFNQGERE